MNWSRNYTEEYNDLMEDMRDIAAIKQKSRQQQPQCITQDHCNTAVDAVQGGLYEQYTYQGIV